MKKLMILFTLFLALIYVGDLYSQNKKFATDSLRVKANLNVLEKATGDTTLWVGGGKVGIGTSVPFFNIDVKSSNVAQPEMRMENNHDNSLGPAIRFLKNGTSPANNDQTGNIVFQGEDDGGNITTFNFINTFSDYIVDGDEAGRTEIRILMNGIGRNMLTFDGFIGIVNQGEIKFNEDAQDVNTHMEAIGAPNAFFVQGSNGFIGMGTSAPEEDLHMVSSFSNAPEIELRSDTDAQQGGILQFHLNSTVVEDFNTSGQIRFRANSSDASEEDVVDIFAGIRDVTAGVTAGFFDLQVQRNGGVNDRVFYVEGYNGTPGEGLIELNGSDNDWDIRMSSVGSINSVFVEGSSGNIGLGTGNPSEKLHIDGAGGADGTGSWIANRSVSTTNATPTTIFPFTTTTDRAYRYNVNIIGAQDDGSNSMGATHSFTFKNVAGTVTEQGDVSIEETDDSAGVSIAGVVSGTDYNVQVTGIAAENWNWEITVNATVVAH